MNGMVNIEDSSKHCSNVIIWNLCVAMINSLHAGYYQLTNIAFIIINAKLWIIYPTNPIFVRNNDHIIISLSLLIINWYFWYGFKQYNNSLAIYDIGLITPQFYDHLQYSYYYIPMFLWLYQTFSWFRHSLLDATVIIIMIIKTWWYF